MASLKFKLEEAVRPSRTGHWLDQDDALAVLALLTAAKRVQTCASVSASEERFGENVSEVMPGLNAAIAAFEGE